MTTPNKIRVACLSCGYRLRAPAEKAGKRGRCPQCGAAVEIPRPEESVADELPLAEETDSGATEPIARVRVADPGRAGRIPAASANAAVDEEVARKWNATVKKLQKQKKQAPPPKSRRWLWVAVAVLAILLAAGAGVAVWLVTNGGEV
ncbi:MAG: hypothetical protein J0I06_25650 [Planctomycetes bacterium]|nr:hypothetical protein [Planctomycetota bacterium]